MIVLVRMEHDRLLGAQPETQLDHLDHGDQERTLGDRPDDVCEVQPVAAQRLFLAGDRLDRPPIRIVEHRPGLLHADVGLVEDPGDPREVAILFPHHSGAHALMLPQPQRAHVMLALGPLQAHRAEAHVPVVDQVRPQDPAPPLPLVIVRYGLTGFRVLPAVPGQKRQAGAVQRPPLAVERFAPVYLDVRLPPFESSVGHRFVLAAPHATLWSLRPAAPAVAPPQAMRGSGTRAIGLLCLSHRPLLLLVARPLPGRSGAGVAAGRPGGQLRFRVGVRVRRLRADRRRTAARAPPPPARCRCSHV